MKYLLAQLKAYKKESILGPLFKLLEATLELLVPLIVAAIIDGGVKTGDKSYILRMSLVMVGLGLAGLASSVTAQYFAAKRRSARPRACAERFLRICRRFRIPSWIRSAPRPCLRA